MRQTIYIFCVLALASCREWRVPVFDDVAASPNVMIGDLRDYYLRAGGEGAELVISDDIVISGRVVSSDRDGNFYNTFFIDDGTGAVEIMAGMPNLDATYHPGQRVSVRAEGLAVGWRDGAMQAGLPPEPGNRFPTGYFYHPVVIGKYVTAERSVEQVTPLEVSFDALDASMCGRLVRISGLRADADSEASTWAQREPYPITGYVDLYPVDVSIAAPISSPNGAPTATPNAVRSEDPITVVTSGYASFALARVPREEISLTGILLYGKGGGSRDHYLIKPRHETDISF